MILFPHAKINIGLYVVNRRSDGFHNIETLFYPVGLRDALEVAALPEGGHHKMHFNASGLAIAGNPERNLVVQAYRLLDEAFSLRSVQVHLHKVIPMGAGLGGGSSDGAHMLMALNRLFSLGLESQQLKEYALRLGSDCPFFIENTPSLGRGRGELLTPLPVNLNGYYIAIVKPELFVSTAQAYASVNVAPPKDLLEEVVIKNPALWGERVRNVFEDSVFATYPEMGLIKQQLYREGALYASMSGSGSALFGIFAHPPQLAHRFPDMFVWEGKATASLQLK